MRIARFRHDDTDQLGIIRDQAIAPLKAMGFDFPDLINVIEGGPDLLDTISQSLSAAAAIPLSEVTLLAPLRPRKFLGLGMNYRRHVEEARKLGVDVPDGQVWFNKQTSCINDPFGDVEMGVTEKLDYEVELGVVIGKPAKSVATTNAMDHVFGYTVVNDFSARDWQFHSSTFTMGKSFDTHGPIGPWIVTADEIADPYNLAIQCDVNGERRQESNTEQMIHRIDALIEYLSTAFTLESGDILSTGTPEGVGAAMQPPSFLKPGDVVRCEIAQIGVIENRVHA